VVEDSGGVGAVRDMAAGVSQEEATVVEDSGWQSRGWCMAWRRWRRRPTIELVCSRYWCRTTVRSFDYSGGREGRRDDRR
jgi:hypothetical protein